MASVEVIGLLCAGSTRYHDYGGSNSNAGDRLSRSELAGLLAGLNSIEMNLALAKYAGDLDAERMLIAQVRVWAAGVAVRESWQIVKGRPTVSNMAALVVFESVRPNTCYRCKGNKVVLNKCCSVCNGSGYKSLSNRKIADSMGIDEAAYRRLWKARYEYCYSYLLGISSRIHITLSLADKEFEYCES